MATKASSFLPISIPTSQFCNEKTNNSSLLSLPSSSFCGNKLLISYSKLRNLALKCNNPSTIFTVLSALPTKKYTSQKIPKWSARAIRSFGLGELEARKLKYPNTGTEALLMGILIEGTSPAAKFLRANGITFFKVREETVELLGKSEMSSLEILRIHFVKDCQIKLESKHGKQLQIAIYGDSGEITTTHTLLGIWSEKESAGHNILETLGFNDDKAKEVAKSMSGDVDS
ncbi:ATP-DEPENDENT CLP PROTEASE ATP-BINDING SUBUNIT CLPT1 CHLOROPLASTIC [Salix koriyanagi]|uniref:ATP-DEPENDENT CLP PROTEASE ATP-BINDING SUBUNIT CLPT1 CHLOROPLASTIC n=1 Tax=Salix koriyanagi TaxID=2511006 RepID=A0A9Q0PIB8_9ROSI|nr:ATP-DEPENDENT CLP PROTEASE ATP-BINDING SUBUNIT CLPT1 CHLOROPLASTIC [Salix koriyanagi]